MVFIGVIALKGVLERNIKENVLTIDFMNKGEGVSRRKG